MPGDDRMNLPGSVDSVRRVEDGERESREREHLLKRVLGALVAAVMSVGVLALVEAQGAQAAPSRPADSAAVAAFTPRLSAWHPCLPASLSGLDCAMLTVPLDYADPAAGTIKVAVSRKKASRKPYRGVLLSNPGGPGGNGRWLPFLQSRVPGGAGQHYDWIGFDPRGVGGSKPSLHCDSSFFGPDRPNYVPTTSRLMRIWLRRAKAYAEACATSSAAALLPHMRTVDTVRDMESLRVALGRTRFSYYGFSYGTYLGQVYATMYPQHVGRFVLDGVVNPKTWWYQGNLAQERWFDRDLNTFFKWVARHPRAYGLGTDWRQIRRGYQAELKVLDRSPADGGRLGPDELTDAMVVAGYSAQSWDSVAHAYARLINEGRGDHLFYLYRVSNMGDDNLFAVYNAVQCSDVHRPAWSRQRDDAWAIYNKFPFLAWDNTWFNAPCRSWPVAGGHRFGVDGTAITKPILLINETRDAATPYHGALVVRSMFPTASLIAGKGGTTHAGSLHGVGCVDFAIARYLNSGAVPDRLSGTRADKVCPRVPPSTATVTSTASSSQSAAATKVAGLTAMPASLQERFWRVQRLMAR